jgi:tetratricopeptide (TPR) repeat protein
MNSWHSWSPNGRWLVFSSKANSPYTQLFLTHIDQQGHSSPPVVLSRFTATDRAANIPEFVKNSANAIKSIREQFIDEASYRRAGNQFFSRGIHDAAAHFYHKTLEIDPNNEDVHNNLGIIFLSGGMPGRAETHFLKAVELKPDFARAYNNLGNAQSRQGKMALAVASLREALRVDPSLCEAHLSLGVILLDEAKIDESLAHLAEAVRLQPGNAPANLYYAEALYRQGQTRQAADHYGRALQADGNSVVALIRLAAIRATSAELALRNGERAVELATRACELTSYGDPEALDALGMAYAEVGRLSDALATAEISVQVALRLGDKALADRVQKRIQLYREKVPVRYRDSRPL